MLSRRQFLVTAAALPVVYSMPALAGGLPSRYRLAANARQLIEAARAQISVTRDYDGSYSRIAYPGGDVPMERGVCSDVIIRAYRAGLGIDLQRLVHEDMARDFNAYPRLWGLKRPDSNIDHRRVPNLMAFFRRRGAELPRGAGFVPGDLVTQTVSGALPHIVLVSDEKVEGTVRYQVIHNIGAGAACADGLEAYPMTGHFRYFV